MATTTPLMGLPLSAYIGQSNPDGPGVWSSKLESMKTIIDGHIHGPSAVINGAAIVTTLCNFAGAGPFVIPAPQSAINLALLSSVGASSNVAVTLPATANSIGCLLLLIDAGFAAATHAINVNRAGSDVIGQAGTNIGMNTNGVVFRLACVAAGQWYLV